MIKIFNLVIIILIIFYIPCKASGKVIPGISIIDLLLAGIIYMMIIRKTLFMKLNNKKLRASKPAIFVILLGIMALLSYLNNYITLGFNIRNLSALLHYIVGITIFLATYATYRKVEDIKRIEKSLLMAMIIIFLVAAIQKIIGPSLSLQYMNWADEWVQWATKMDFRVYSLLGNPLHVASFTVYIFGLASVFFFSREKPIQALIYMVIALITILLTKSRSPILCLLIIIPSSAFFVKKYIGCVNTRINRIGKSIGIMSIIIAISLIVLPGRIKSVNVTDREFYSKTMRVPLYYTAIGSILDYPILGTGPGGLYGYFSKSDFIISLGVNESSFTADNLFLQIGGEVGLPGLIFFLFAILLSFRNSIKYVRASRDKKEMAVVLAMIVGLLGFYLQALFQSSTILPLRTLMWMSLGALAALEPTASGRQFHEKAQAIYRHYHCQLERRAVPIRMPGINRSVR